MLGLEFSPDGMRLLARCRNETGLRIWDLKRMVEELKNLDLVDRQ